MEDRVVVSINLSSELLARVDAVIPKGKRTSFILDAVAEFIKKNEIKKLEEGCLQGLA